MHPNTSLAGKTLSSPALRVVSGAPLPRSSAPLALINGITLDR
jgi:hypothetical protein